MEQKKIDKLGFVKAFKYRNNLLLFIGNNIKKPSEIAIGVDISDKNISQYLKEFKELCLNSGKIS